MSVPTYVHPTDTDGSDVYSPANPPSGSGGMTLVELDFGTIPVIDKTFTVTDARVSATSQIIMQQSGAAPTGRNADENEMDQIRVVASPGTGSFTVWAQGTVGPVVGKYKFSYLVG